MPPGRYHVDPDGDSGHYFREIIENCPLVIWLADPLNHRLLYLSAAYEDLWGRPRDEVYRDRWAWLQGVHPEDRDRVLAASKAVPLDQPMSAEYRVVRPDGTVREVRGRRFPILGMDGRVVRIAGTVGDTTDFTNAAAGLSEREAILRAVIDGTTDIVALFDQDSRFLLANKAAAERLSRSPEDLVGCRIDEALGPGNGERLMADDRRIMAHGGVETYEETVHRPAPEGDRVMSTTKGAWRNAKGEVAGVFVIARDITERNRLEAKLRDNQRLESFGQLAGGIAHDYNNMTGVILGYAELVLRELGPEHPVRQDIEEIRAAARRSAELTRQLLAFSRQLVLEPRVLDLNALVLGFAKMLRRVIGEHIELALRCKEDVGRVKADQGQIEQVLLNLALNARDAMPEGGRLTIETALRRGPCDEETVFGVEALPGPCAVISVSDTGSGISPEVLPRIFDPFFTTKPSGQGTGLGLASAYGIVKQSGGNIAVSSQPGRGSVFRICLPLVEEAVETSAPASAGGGTPAGTVPVRGTVLLVEDEERLRALISRMLRSTGYRVIEACDGDEALSYLQSREGTIDLLVTDMVMPKRGGADLVEDVARLEPELPVLVISGYTRGKTLEDKPGRGFVQKPFTAEQLNRKVNEVLASARTKKG